MCGEANVLLSQQPPSGKDGSEPRAFCLAHRDRCRCRIKAAEGIQYIISRTSTRKAIAFVPIPSKPRCSSLQSTQVMLKLYKIHRLQHPNRLRTGILILQKTEIISLAASLSSVICNILIYIQFHGWSRHEYPATIEAGSELMTVSFSLMKEKECERVLSTKGKQWKREDCHGGTRTWHETCSAVPKSFFVTGIKYIVTSRQQGAEGRGTYTIISKWNTLFSFTQDSNRGLIVSRNYRTYPFKSRERERQRGERKLEEGVRDATFTGNKKYVTFSGFEGVQAVSTRPSDRGIFERGSSFMEQKVKSLECGLFMSRGKKLRRSISKGKNPSNIRYRFS